MGDLIKIVGVQYAVNSTHVKGKDMTAQRTTNNNRIPDHAGQEAPLYFSKARTH